MPPSTCPHSTLYHDTCDDAQTHTPWRRPQEPVRLAANTLDGRLPDPAYGRAPKPSSFPGPLVMPDDALAIDPYSIGESQRLHDFVHERCRNAVTPERNVIYVFDAPTVSSELTHARSWTEPTVPPGDGHEPPTGSSAAQRPAVEAIADYVEAFYHGMTVRIVRDGFRLVPWEVSKKRRRPGMATPQYVGLAADSSKGIKLSEPIVTRIRHRPSRDGVAAEAQLNLNDLLDGLLAALPADAFAAVLLMHHDMYEDEQDDFCCGRAYGGSRICVISTFRYHPKLGPFEGIMLDHTWPNAHCREYVDDVWSCMLERDGTVSSRKTKRAQFKADQMAKLPSSVNSKRAKAASERQLDPLPAAVVAARAVSSKRVTREEWDAIWLARACVVAVHELGHCVEIGHCVHYACVMQGTASVAEDTQQPPYLCPVCHAKVAYALAVEPASRRGGAPSPKPRVEDAFRWEIEREWTVKQYRALQDFCQKKNGAVMFKGLEAWIRARLVEMEADEDTGLREKPAPASRISKPVRSASHFADMMK